MLGDVFDDVDIGVAETALNTIDRLEPNPKNNSKSTITCENKIRTLKICFCWHGDASCVANGNKKNSCFKGKRKEGKKSPV